MDLKRYRKTRYQNIYQHIKNKNYLIDIANPKTSVGILDGKKIFDINIALKTRDNLRKLKSPNIKIAYSEDFTTLWNKYMYDCENVKKLKPKTLKRKRLLYERYYKFEFLDKKVSKIKRDDVIDFINKIKTTDKEKNEILRKLKSFFNWCINPEQEYLIKSPTYGIKPIKTPKPKMKYWLPNHFKEFLNCVNEDLKSSILKKKHRAYIIKIFALLGFKIGDRPGETLSTRFCDISKEYRTIRINGTKTEKSQRTIDISDLLINEIDNYKDFLINEVKFDVNDNMPIMINKTTGVSYSDCTLRKLFNYYIDKSKVPKIRLYDLRHTFVATMMSEGWELYHISEILGHESYNTTVDRYGHISSVVRKEIANTTDKYC